MKKNYDPIIIQHYMDKYSIQNYFSNTYDFFLCEYEKNEIIVHPTKKTRCLEFILKGRVSIYAISEDGNQKYVADSRRFTFLGDMEFVLNEKPVFFAECKTKVISLCLPIEENRHKLSSDFKFLHFILHSLADKVSLFSNQEIFLDTVEEKVLHYAKKQEIKNIGLLANNFHCSRRQLQRTLSKLCDTNVLRKKEKGVYILIRGKYDDKMV